MKIISAAILALSIAAPVMAEDRAPQLPPIDAGSIWNQINNQHNPFPQPTPTTLDTCVFTEFKNNKCYFKCQSGAVLVEPAVKPDFTTGEPAGACATHIIRTIPAGPFHKAAQTAQTFKSFGKYASEQEAAAAMNWAVNGLTGTKAAVTGQKLIANGPSNYSFEIAFTAKKQLIIEPAPSFKRDIDAYEHMFDLSSRLESQGASVAITEVIKYGPAEYSYVIGYFRK